MIGQASQRISRCLVTELVFKRPLFCDVYSDDFMPRKISLFVKNTASADPDLQHRAVLPLPLCFHRLNLQCLAGFPRRWRARTEMREEFSQFFRCQDFLFGGIAEHVNESLVGIENFPFRVTPVYSICRI